MAHTHTHAGYPTGIECEYGSSVGIAGQNRLGSRGQNGVTGERGCVIRQQTERAIFERGKRSRFDSIPANCCSRASCRTIILLGGALATDGRKTSTSGSGDAMDGWKHRSIHWRIHLIDSGEGTTEARTWPSHWHFDRLSPESIDVFFFLSLSLFVRQHYFFFFSTATCPRPLGGVRIWWG